MTFAALIWIFVAAVGLHNLEEAVWLPAWSQAAGRWHHPIGGAEFRFAVLVLTLFAAIAAWLAMVQGKGSIGAYVVSGYALAMLLNVAMPHLLATAALGRYMPGTATALAFNLPVCAALLYQAGVEGYLDGGRFLVAGSAVVLAIVASIPILFWVGRKLTGNRPEKDANRPRRHTDSSTI